MSDTQSQESVINSTNTVLPVSFSPASENSSAYRLPMPHARLIYARRLSTV